MFTAELDLLSLLQVGVDSYYQPLRAILTPEAHQKIFLGIPEVREGRGTLIGKDERAGAKTGVVLRERGSEMPQYKRRCRISRQDKGGGAFPKLGRFVTISSCEVHRRGCGI